MIPGFIHWWSSAHGREGERAQAGCGSVNSSRSWGYRCGTSDEDAGSGLGGGFGVRRPLRFLAYKLELDEAQVAELARILAELKTERAQAAVDDRRTGAAFADAVAGGTFDTARANEGAAVRLRSAERLRDAVVTALGRIHQILRDEQRARLAYLIRTGTLSL